MITAVTAVRYQKNVFEIGDVFFRFQKSRDFYVIFIIMVSCDFGSGISNEGGHNGLTKKCQTLPSVNHENLKVFKLLFF